MTSRLFGHVNVVEKQETGVRHRELTTCLNEAILLAPSLLLMPSRRGSKWLADASMSRSPTRILSVTGRVFINDTDAPSTS